MKNILIALVLILLSSGAFSQELGLRIGDAHANDVAVDGIFKFGKFNRLHGDVSFGHSLGIDLLWDFLYKPFNIEDQGFHWYVGAGPSMIIDDSFWLGISGEIGVEYHFVPPLALGIDWRPTLYIIDDADLRAEGFGVNIRYVFGKKDK